MITVNKDYTLIDTSEGLHEFAKDNSGIEWMGFDTEFIGEKRYITLLCLIQVSTPNGNYLIDTLKVKDIEPLLNMLTDGAILKISHAGENDYRLMNTLYGIIPKNIFDTQIAAGFMGFHYPVAFRHLLSSELKVKLNKSYTVTDWQIRPLKQKQVNYALNDVIYLKELYDRMVRKLNRYGHMDWLNSELSILEKADYYQDDEHREALESRLILKVNKKEQIFLVRLYEWRRSRAKAKNYSKEMILPQKMISVIVGSMSSGKNALLDNRIVSSKIIEKNWKTFDALYKAEATKEELDRLKRIPKEIRETPEKELTTELLFLLIKKKCQDAQIAHSLVISKNMLKRLRNDQSYKDVSLTTGWRGELLGENLKKWITHEGDVSMEMREGECIIKM